MDSMTPMDDGMVAKQSVKSDRVVPVHDAGTEANTELRAPIPGPPCGNNGAVEGAESTVGPHGGILDVGDLDPRGVGWLHPVLEVSVQRWASATTEGALVGARRLDVGVSAPVQVRQRRSSRKTSGCDTATSSSVLAAPVGSRRPCSQSCNVLADTPSRLANSRCDRPTLARA